MSVKKRHPFEQLREKRTFSERLGSVPTILFQLRFVDETGCLFIVNESGNETDADYRDYSGQIREILKVIHLLEEKNGFYTFLLRIKMNIKKIENGYLTWHLNIKMGELLIVFIKK